MANFLGGFASSSQLPLIDGVTVNLGDMAYTVDDGGFWSAQQPASPPGAQPQWAWIDQLRGSPGPTGPVGVGLPGPAGQIGPPGKMGGTGPQGPAGKNTFCFLEKMFNVPDIAGPPFTATVSDSSWMTPGLLVYIPGGGTFTCIGSPPDGNTVILANSGDANNAPTGTLISAGTQISPASLRGPIGDQGIPGPAGPPGPQGVSGQSVFTTLAQAFTVPPAGTSGLAFVVASQSFAAGQIVYIAGGDYFSVQAVDTVNLSLTLVNQGYPGGQPPGTVLPVGATVSATGPQGPVGPAGVAGPQGIQGPVGFAPTGTIAMYGAITPPGGWLLCDGSTVSTTGFSALFSIISTTYNTGGEAAGTFRLPNLKGRFALGAGQSTAVGNTNHALASMGGEETHALAVAEMAVHAHTISVAVSVGSHTHGMDHTHNMDHYHNITASGAHTHTATQPAHNHGVAHNVQNQWASGVSVAVPLAHCDGAYDYFSTSVAPVITVAAVGNIGPTNTVYASQTNGAWVNTLYASQTNAAWANTGATTPSVTASGSAANTGSGTAHNNMPPFQTVNYIIKT